MSIDKKEIIAGIYDRLKEKLSLDQAFVPGEGNLDCTLMLVGEAPGAKETELHRPFVGKAGKNLDEFLEVIHRRREDIYITNAVKFRPYKLHPLRGTKSNRPPVKDEIALCLPTLKEEISAISPSIIVTLGNTALKTVSGDDNIRIGDCHGTKISYDEACILFALYHPASIIYNRSLGSVYSQDLQYLSEILAEMQ